MAKKKNATRKKKKAQSKQPIIISGISLIAFGLFGLFRLGFLGVLAANICRFFVGNTYPLFAILLVTFGGVLIFLKDKLSIGYKKRFLGGVLAYLGLLLFLHAQWFGTELGGKADVISLTFQGLFSDLRSSSVSQSVGGGMIGALLYSASHFLISQVGSYILAISLMSVGVLLLLNVKAEQLNQFFGKIGEKIATIYRTNQENKKEKAQQKSLEQAEKQKEMAEEEKRKAEEIRQNSVRDLSDGEKLAQEERQVLDQVVPEQLSLEIDSYQKNYQKDTEKKQKKASKEADMQEEALDFEIAGEKEDRDYQLPPSSLLNEIPLTDQSGEYAQIEEKVSVLERTFESFGVKAKVVRASLGPSVTKFEVQPSIGVKVSKVVSLTDDLALALAAKDVRIEAPIPGKSLIGIEVPNNTVSMVSFRDIVEAQPDHPDKILEVPLGRDISGSVVSADLIKMPHMLIAGSTGSGKSVCINSIITSILMRAKPHEVKMMMIDPKMVELNVYNGIPHLLTPVVTNPRKAAQALHKVVQEMERRYELFAGSGVRNIGGYNDLVIQHNLETGDERPILPYIVVIVDELADLMMVASNEVEDAIIRLAQMARAAGIHMILATQRPSVDVITGIIKANVPSRIAFAVSSGTDSRTIIDSNGAEKLLGRGDMLFLPMGENKPIRVQGAFISDQEVEKVVSFVTDQQEAEYQENMMPSEEKEGANAESQDELYDQAVEMVVEMQTASVSLVQRRFRVGYNRAARLIDEMEQNGVVGPSEGSKPRKVFLTHVEEETSGTAAEESTQES